MRRLITSRSYLHRRWPATVTAPCDTSDERCAQERAGERGGENFKVKVYCRKLLCPCGPSTVSRIKRAPMWLDKILIFQWLS